MCVRINSYAELNNKFGAEWPRVGEVSAKPPTLNTTVWKTISTGLLEYLDREDIPGETQQSQALLVAEVVETSALCECINALGKEIQQNLSWLWVCLGLKSVRLETLIIFEVYLLVLLLLYL